MTNRLDVRFQPHLTWPLPATREAHAHLTWAEWTAQQAASDTRRKLQVPALDQHRPIARLDRTATARLTWPLPATLLPNARLSWAAWLDAQSRKPLVAREDATEQTVETAA